MTRNEHDANQALAQRAVSYLVARWIAGHDVVADAARATAADRDAFLAFLSPVNESRMRRDLVAYKATDKR